MQSGLKTVIEVPLTIMRLGDSAWEPLLEVVKYGNPASKSAVQVGVRALETGIWGVYQNVLINMVEIKDGKYKKHTVAEAKTTLTRAREKCDEVLGDEGSLLEIQNYLFVLTQQSWTQFSPPRSLSLT